MCEEKPINANEALFLEEKEIIDLSEKAKNGDGEAALSLGSYFSKVLQDRDRAAEWYKQGADNENVICQYNYALYLINKGDEKNTNDAINYLKKASEKGFSPAKKAKKYGNIILNISLPADKLR